MKKYSTKSIKYNFIFNLIKVLSTVLFPMITIPYLSRVLGPSGVGKIAFADSVIQYFILIAFLGIPIYGVREVARVRGDSEKLKTVTSELFLINVIMAFFTYVGFLVLILFVPKINTESTLFLVSSINIIFTVIGLEWFFQGVDKYDFIAVRSIAIKIICIVLMFVFVEEKSDYVLSAGITAFGMVGNNILNIIYARQNIKIKKQMFQTIKKHFKPIITVFSMVLAASIYTYLTNVILGFVDGDESVAYYTSASKMIQISIMVVASLGTVIIPRATELVEKNKKIEYDALIIKLFSFTFFSSFIMAIFLFILSKQIVMLFFGLEFLPTRLPMMIMSANIFLGSMSYMLGHQVLYPNNKDKLVAKSLLFGAIINIGLNIILIPKYSYVGAAIALFLTEFFVLALRYFYSTSIIKFSIVKNVYKYLISSFITFFYLLFVRSYCIDWISLILFSSIGVILYVVVVIILKDKLILDEFLKIKNKFVKNNS